MPDDWLGLRGRRVLVLGAGGLGAACVRAFLAAGAHVVAVDARPESLAALTVDERDLSEAPAGETGPGEGGAGATGAFPRGAVAADLAAAQTGSAHEPRPAAEAGSEGGPVPAGGRGPEGRRLATVTADLSTPEGCRAAVATAASTLGGLDVFVHAIGVNHRTPIVELSDEAWDEVQRINLGSAFWSGQAAGRLLVAQGSGSLVFFSSVSGLLAHADHGPYAASKGGLNQLLRVMAREWAGHGVSVNAVAPAYTNTALTRAYLDRDNHREELIRVVPAGRLGTPEDVVGPVLFLSSPRSSFITGQILYVDGGRTLV